MHKHWLADACGCQVHKSTHSITFIHMATHCCKLLHIAADSIIQCMKCPVVSLACKDFSAINYINSVHELFSKAGDKLIVYLYLADFYSSEPTYLSSKTTKKHNHYITVCPQALNSNFLQFLKQ